jgi:hypothetical protein
VLEEQLAATRHETEDAHLQEFLLMEDHEQAVVAGILQGTDVTLTTMQLRIGQDFRPVEPGFSCHTGKTEWAELVSDFIATAGAVVATVNVEDTSVAMAKGLRLYLVPFL